MPRVLIVDDDPDILATLAEALPSFAGDDLEVGTASSGEEAIQRLEGSPYDAVISDERMPGMQGIELLARVRRTHPRSVRILMTAFTDAGIRERAARQAGIHLFLAKPFELAPFAGTLRTLLAALPAQQR